MMNVSRRRVAFRPALETLSLRITPSDLLVCGPMPMPTDSMPATTSTPTMPSTTTPTMPSTTTPTTSTSTTPSTSTSTYTPNNVPPMYPPDGTPGTTPADYV
jgi:hypothetical protein